MRIVADENIVAVDEYFSAYGKLVKLPGRQITAADVRDADALLVRSITPVNEKLLSGSRVKFVATATSGTDHLDLDWLDEAGIYVSDAAGCNANAVVEYVFAAISTLLADKKLTLTNKTFAVIGAGHVGGRLLRLLSFLGVECIACDPFVDHSIFPGIRFVTLEQALKANIISLHTPLTTTGPHVTLHMLDDCRLASLQPGTLLINAARGEVVDNDALLKLLDSGADLLTVFDVWENEPQVNAALAQTVDIATPHIAGYSMEAKLAASVSNYRAFMQHFGLQERNDFVEARTSGLLLRKNELAGFVGDKTAQLRVAEKIDSSFDLRKLSQEFKRGAGQCDGAALFDSLRKSLISRREFGLLHSLS